MSWLNYVFTVIAQDQDHYYYYYYYYYYYSNLIALITGGLKAVMYTDTFQTVVMVIGSAVVMVASKCFRKNSK